MFKKLLEREREWSRWRWTPRCSKYFLSVVILRLHWTSSEQRVIVICSGCFTDCCETRRPLGECCLYARPLDSQLLLGSVDEGTYLGRHWDSVLWLDSRYYNLKSSAFFFFFDRFNYFYYKPLWSHSALRMPLKTSVNRAATRRSYRHRTWIDLLSP